MEIIAKKMRKFKHERGFEGEGSGNNSGDAVTDSVASPPRAGGSDGNNRGGVI